MTVAAASDGRALLRTVSLHRWLGQAAHVEQTTLFGESYVYGCIKSGEEHGFAPLNAKNPRGAGCWGDPGNGVQIGWFLWGEALARKAVGLPAVEPEPDSLASNRQKSDDEQPSALVAGDRNLLEASPCDVTHYGALGDNRTEATSAFQAAIAACTGRARGAVVVPAGTYLLRPVELFSHTTLVIERGATLVAWSGVGWKAGWPNSTSATCTASPYESKTPAVLPQLESLLYVDGVTNVTIKGGGRLDGQGWRWWPLRDKSEYWHHCKPSLIRLGGGNSTRTSSHLTVDNLALHNSPHFNIQAWTDHTRYTRINFTADTCPLNTDSLHVGGWNVHVADCNVHSGDDCVPISKYSKDVLVERVQCSCGNGASPLIWGTQDKDAYIRNVTFRDMTFTGTRFGANIKSLASYLGTLHDVVFENFVLHDVAKAINIDLKGQNTNKRHGDTDTRAQTIRVRNVTFRNFTGDARVAGTFTCPGSGTCSGILLEDIDITGTQEGFVCSGGVAGHAIRTSPPAKCMDPEEPTLFAPRGEAQAAEQRTRLALKSSVRTKSDDESTAGPLGLWMPWQGTVFADARAGVPEGAPLYSAFRFGVVGMFGKDEGFADIGADLEFHCTTLANRTERIWGIVGPQGGGSTLNNPNDTNMSSISPRPFGMIQAAARYVFSRASVLLITLKLPTTV